MTLNSEKSVIQQAVTAAATKTADMLSQNPGQWFPCGFSWVRIRPARGPIVKALKELGLGKSDSFEGGYVVYNPSGNNTQWMDAKMAGSREFARVLNEHFKTNGIKSYANAEQRID